LSLDASRCLFYDKEIIIEDKWSQVHFEKSLQFQGDLGKRMTKAFESVLESNNKAVIIGSDCPEISAKLIEEAFLKLNDKDVVIGPTYDGGYYLLGMKNLHQELFQNIDWSTEKVFDQTVNKIVSLDLSFDTLEKLTDLDDMNYMKSVKSVILSLT